jgi:hypothetical protein
VCVRVRSVTEREGAEVVDRVGLCGVCVCG